MIEFAMSVPPTANHMFFNVKGRGRVKTPEYAAWRDHTAWFLKSLRLGCLEGPVRVDIDLPANKRRDIDNSIKPILDCIQSAGLVQNDRQVRALWVQETDRADVLVKVTAL
jgi:crossover junction endodeoxyribonuclease RusA